MHTSFKRETVYPHIFFPDYCSVVLLFSKTHCTSTQLAVLVTVWFEVFSTEKQEVNCQGQHFLLKLEGGLSS